MVETRAASLLKYRFYDLAQMHNHLHVVSETTGDVRDVPEHLGQKLLHELCPEALKRIEAELGFQIKQVHIELLGDFHDPQV